MRISVIIPVKNRADLLSVTLENIFTQTLQPYEIIVVNDHSTDDLSTLKRKYRDRVMFIDSVGTGPGAARNTGMEISTGNYIQFFDSDDLMTKDKLYIQAHQLEDSRKGMAYCPHVKASYNPASGWIQTDSILFYKPLSSKYRYDQWVIRGACMITQACLFRKDLLTDIGPWRTDLMTHEDLEFLFRVGQAEPFPVHSHIPAVIYRQHLQQITDKQTTKSGRALDQLNAYQHISENMVSQTYSQIDKVILENNFIRASTYVEPSLWSVDYSKLNTARKRALFKFEKAIHKIQRTFTRSDWRFVHGISNNPEHFKSYISRIG